MFTIKTELDYETMLSCAKLRFWSRKNIICLVFLGILSLLAFTFDMIGGGIFFGVASIIILALWFLLPIIVKKKFKKNTFAKNTSVVYKFNEDKTINIVTTRNDEKLSEINLKQPDIIKIKETKQFLLIFVSKHLAYYINKKLLSSSQIQIIKEFCPLNKKHYN